MMVVTTFQCESEKTTAGIMKTASRALVATHAQSSFVWESSQGSCALCSLQTHAIALDQWHPNRTSLTKTVVYFWVKTFGQIYQ